ncbi:MAG TPA: CocE/NonD family hydrolase [Polyangiaceae bacterium]|nr:CocE/NonD family hydrolase [Polyangiaceae bacterium]
MSLATDRADWHTTTKRERPRAERRALYVAMRDGARIALDVHLPRLHGERLPTIVRSTRYYRGIALKQPFALLPIEWMLDSATRTRERMLAAGYAWVDVCARGSGASFGHRPSPWSPDEIADGREIIDWIVKQPWSNGRVGATGISYSGTATDFLVATGHPALLAAAPQFSLYDVYADVAFPGGIHLHFFTERWAAFNRALDRGRFDEAFELLIVEQAVAWRATPKRLAGLWNELTALATSRRGRAFLRWLMRRVARGVRRVDDDHDGRMLASAIASHADNFDVHQGALQLTHRDDVGISLDYPDRTIDAFSPHAHRREMESSNAAIYSFSGWSDAAYGHAAIKRFTTLDMPHKRLILGPWDHAGLHQVSPYSPASASAFDQPGELLRFFDAVLRDVEHGDPPVRYFTIGKESWRSASTWPPESVIEEPWFLCSERRLARTAGSNGTDEYRVDPNVGSGARSRYNSLFGMLPPVGYGDRAAIGKRLLVYRSEPLEEPLEVTGHPLVHIHLASSERDAHLFAYLEDERPDGRVEGVTDGQLRALHRALANGTPPYRSPAPYRSFERAHAQPLEPREPVELVFDLLPTSWLFQRGHRIRLALAGADSDHFIGLHPTPELAIFHGPSHPSRILLPVSR